MKKLLVGATIALSAIALSGCGDSAPKAGVVVSTEFNAAHDDPQMYCAFYSMINKIMVCTIYATEMIHYDNEWSLEIKNAQEKKKGWTDVTQQQYNRCQIDDQWPQCGAP